MTRVAFIGVGHWHRYLYMDPLLRIEGAKIVGVSDHELETAEHWGRELDCVATTSPEELCSTVQPDFVFALGRHCDMAGTAEYLMRADIPFAMEKPCGLNVEELEVLAKLQDELGAFAAVPFVWRQTELVTAIRERLGYENLRYVLFRRMLGPPDRYLNSGCGWMLDPEQAGGGNTLNVGTHWIDLFCHFMGDRPVEVVASHMSNELYGHPVEDYSVLTLRSGGVTCVTDTGYVYPGKRMDLHHSVIAEGGYLIVRGDEVGELSRPGLPDEELPISKLPDYGRFVTEVLAQAANDDAPIATMRDMLRVMEICEAAYELAGWPRGRQQVAQAALEA